MVVVELVNEFKKSKFHKNFVVVVVVVDVPLAGVKEVAPPSREFRFLTELTVLYDIKVPDFRSLKNTEKTISKLFVLWF